ncbi:MAG: CvfD/Ygs/GSP13 family RNA-binding post-transcriptional regulator [Atopostipes suicloacalis]|nr:CvfD/Ygs/GSP13 family RNA-binding post-transcriptional regulator [Atopostipes suicloacalis]MDN6731487.1 CvfD/Ygs/GSP13 family RNA-binding post-transcriptional regulator [Atopostipes suicloacalis]
MSDNKYKIGDIVKVEISGIQNYGAFAKLDESTQGLIHISEIKHSYIDKDLKDIFRIGEEVEVMILDIDEYDGRISLSVRALLETKNHPFSNRKSNPRYGRKTGTAFSTIAKKLPGWIDEEFNKTP